MAQKSSKRPWRKLVKKLQRKRKRQKLAQQRDKEFEDANAEKVKDPLYKSWLEQQEKIERLEQLAEENQRQEEEELWLRRELLSQKQFKKDEMERQAEEAKLEAERLKQEEELKLLNEVRQKKREEIRLQAEKAAKEFDNIMNAMQEYLEDCTLKTPTELDCVTQSRPGEKSCDFFDKTNCCRFGATCSFNHRRPMLAKIIKIKHFFQHPLLEQQEHEEYSRSDSDLELSERDLRDSYDEFCEDVWPVLQEFGHIINFRTVRNVESHLRGHVFVEYYDKRSALRAFTNLQNRYYASKRLNVEFSNIQQWRKAVCGPSLGRKCPKGVKCNFFHLMKNIDNKYNRRIDKTERSLRGVSKSTTAVRESPALSWNSEDVFKNKSSCSRNWRWSESPEIELKNNMKDENFNVKNDTNYKNLSDHSQRKSSSRKSRSKIPKLCYRNTKKSESASSSSINGTNSINATCNSHTFESGSKNKDAEKSRSHRRKQSLNKSRSPSLNYAIDSKRSRSKTPVNKKIHNSHNKSKNHHRRHESPNGKKLKRSK